jgi:hypothetical protein
VAVVVGAFAVGCGGLQLPHPCPTPRAVAREAGGRWCIVPTVICPPPPHCLPIRLLAPAIHPTSSCSWAWGQVLHHLHHVCCCCCCCHVLCCHCVVVVVVVVCCCCLLCVFVVVVVVPPSRHCMAPGAPAIHPTSSCSSAWGWVLH